MIHSGIYDAEIRHTRRAPAHAVNQRLRLAYLDLDELGDMVGSRRGWSRHPAPVWFRRRDYLDGTNRPLGPAVANLVEERTGRRPHGPIRILTQLRTLGWLFNPLTTYYLFDPDGITLSHVVLEITNTPWHERHFYVLDAETVAGPGAPFAKEFHVSPFLPMNLDYRCRTEPPGERLDLRFALLTAGNGTGADEVVFTARLTGRRVPLDAPVDARSVARSLSQTTRVSAGIYAHAAWLSVRRAHFYRHPGRKPEAGPGPKPQAERPQPEYQGQLR